jgi:hypothetical protein
MASMTPEQRERFIERMRARGIAPPGGDVEVVPAAQRSRTTEAARSNEPAAQVGRGVTTFDALFGPLTPTESFGQVWLHQDGKLLRVRLRLGITDGQQTELIQALDGNLQEGSEVVTSVTTGATRATTAAPAGANTFPGLGGGRPGLGGGGGRGRGF